MYSAAKVRDEGLGHTRFCPTPLRNTRIGQAVGEQADGRRNQAATNHVYTPIDIGLVVFERSIRSDSKEGGESSGSAESG